MLVRHPQWVRRLGWLGIPIMTLCSIYLITIPIIESRYDVVGIVSTSLLGGGCLYMCLIAFKVFPFLNSEIKLNGNGFSIYKKSGTVINHQWSEVGQIKHYASVQILVLSNKSGKTMVAVTEQASYYYNFVGVAVNKTGLKY